MGWRRLAGTSQSRTCAGRSGGVLYVPALVAKVVGSLKAGIQAADALLCRPSPCFALFITRLLIHAVWAWLHHVWHMSRISHHSIMPCCSYILCLIA